ncbi:MAG TPA: hypothetical protein VIG33_09590 [Pseudobdellovibrionaceae bacterium]
MDFIDGLILSHGEEEPFLSLKLNKCLKLKQGEISMKKLILATVLLASAFANAEDRKVYNVITKQSDIVSVLSNLIQLEKEGVAQRSGTMYDLTALSLSGYQVVKITFRDSFGDGKYCSADLTFNKSDINDNQFMSFMNMKQDANRWTIFVPYCK